MLEISQNKIDKEYFKYLHNDLGFIKSEIQRAWQKANEIYPNEKKLVLEVLTRDILRGDYKPQF